MPWKINELQLQKAIEEFDLRWPVRIKLTGHKGGRYGAYWLRYDWAKETFYHHITVKRWLSKHAAGQTLWHELTHAKQAERIAERSPREHPIFAWDEARKREAGGPYRDRISEKEASANEIRQDKRSLTIYVRAY